MSIVDAVKTKIRIDLREEIHRKTARISVDGGGSGTYTVTIDANAVGTPTGAGTDLEILEDLRDAINADATVSLIVTASVSDDRLVLTGIAEADYTVAVSTNLVGDELTISHEDASEASARVYLLEGGTGDPPSGWAVADTETAFAGLDYLGRVERLSTAGSTQCYVEIFDVSPASANVGVSIGPGVQE